MTTFTFNSRASYLEYRANWKNAYAELTLRQRNTKNELKKKFRANATNAYIEQSAVASNKYLANEMLDELKMAKEEASRQYHAAKVSQETVTV